MASLIADGVPPSSILHVAFDDIGSLEKPQDPILLIARWSENKVLVKTFNESARDSQPAHLLFDEVQNLPSWAPQIKHLVDNHDVRALITGSSSLRIESGRDSLAGRITTFDLGALLLREIAAIRSGSTIEPFWKDNGLESLLHPDLWREANHRGVEDSHERLRASREFSRRGAYPIAHDRADVSWPALAGNLNETVIKRAIQHDLRMGSRGQKRDEKLLEEVFRLCCRYAGQAPGQSVFVPEIQQALAGNVGWNRILNYLRF
jgi:predicted AAA+ superfamily ATPase